MVDLYISCLKDILRPDSRKILIFLLFSFIWIGSVIESYVKNFEKCLGEFAAASIIFSRIFEFAEFL